MASATMMFDDAGWGEIEDDDLLSQSNASLSTKAAAGKGSKVMPPPPLPMKAIISGTAGSAGVAKKVIKGKGKIKGKQAKTEKKCNLCGEILPLHMFADGRAICKEDDVSAESLQRFLRVKWGKNTSPRWRKQRKTSCDGSVHVSRFVLPIRVARSGVLEEEKVN